MSYLGPHINAAADQIAWLRRAKPRVGKVLLDGLDPAWMREAKAASPRTFWGGRLYTPNQDLAKGAEFTAELLRAAEPFRGLLDALEGYNEINPTTAAEMSAYAECERARSETLHAHGWKSCVGNFATGNPETPARDPAIWRAFYPALWAGDYLGLHEYTPTLPRNPNDDTWHQLRYRRVYEALPAELRKPLIITECGVDDGHGGGWQRHGSVAEYLDYLRWYDAALQEDALRWPIIGATIYLYGHIDPTWDSFEISGEVADLLAAHCAASPSYWHPTDAIEEGPMVDPYKIGPIFEQWGWPITGHFGETRAPYPATGHLGVDYACPEGTPVLAAFDGIVDLCDAHPSKGNRINIVDPTQLLEAVYYHLREVPPFQPGQSVKAGEVIGYTGNSGYSTGAHLHFGLLVVRNDPPAWSVVGWINPLGAGVVLAASGDAQLQAQLAQQQSEIARLSGVIQRVREAIT